MLIKLLYAIRSLHLSLFKFIEKEFLDSFFATGCLRLGTIYDFKDIEEHGISRGDHSEGEHHLIRGIDGTVKLTKNKHEPLISEVFKFEGEGEASISNLSIVVPRRCEDGFIFCTSNQYNENLFRDWKREDNLDSCYEIVNVRGFIQAVNKAISNSAFFYANSDVIYTEDQIDYQSKHANAHPAFTKLKNKYGWQKENRSVWGAKAPCIPLKPWIIHVPDAIQYCRPFAFIENDIVRY
ncbi:MAG: hypothetical protein ACI8UC_001216 [Psychromonas sp.]|jgi:hypothetical protein